MMENLSERKSEGEASAVKSVSRWDTSRSIAELVDRMKDAGSLEVENPNLENVATILRNASTRVDQADFFAQVVAMFEKDGNYVEKLDSRNKKTGEEVQSGCLEEVLKPLADTAAIWNSGAVFQEVTDKVPGKLVPFWLQMTYKVMGAEFMVDQTMKLPYRLWSHVEKILHKDAEHKDLLKEKVFETFAGGKVNAEMYFWLWKMVPANDRDKEIRIRYMSDSYLLFKTLHVEQKGSYLKSQRSLRKLLVDDEKFQKTVMNYGDPEAIRSLVRCVKHQPLLDAGERQALLVKIVRDYDQALAIVEERKQAHRSVGKITSIRSYEAAKAELADLINVQIPENVAAIEHARGLGDLRENSEFKFAKERQALLSKQRNELEKKLSETRTVDFRDVQVNGVVVPGCAVEVTYDKNGKSEKFWILGRFDSIPEENKVSYETPLGKTLMGHKVNDKIEMPSGDNAVISSVSALDEKLLVWLASMPDNAVKEK